MSDTLTIRLLDRDVVLKRHSGSSYGTDDGQFALTYFNPQSIYGGRWVAQAFDGGLCLVDGSGVTWDRAVGHLNEKLGQLRKWEWLR